MTMPDPPDATTADETIEVTTFDLTRGNVEAPIALAMGPAGGLAVAWVEGTKRDFTVVVARREEGKWLRATLGKAASGYPPRPHLAYLENGDILVAWDGRWDLPGGGFARWTASTRTWSPSTSFDETCRGEVWLCGGEAAFVRKVSRLNLGGVFSHEGTRKHFDKIGIAALDKDGWDGTRTIEEGNDLNCRSPAMSTRFVAYVRKKSEQEEEVVVRDRKHPDAEVTLGASAGPAGIAIGDTGSEAVLCFGAVGGVRAARNLEGRWTESALAIPATRLLACGVATFSSGTAIWAVDRGNLGIKLAWLRDGRWSAPETIARGEGAAIAIAPDGNSGMIAWAAGWSPFGRGATAKRTLKVRSLPLK